MKIMVRPSESRRSRRSRRIWAWIEHRAPRAAHRRSGARARRPAPARSRSAGAVRRRTPRVRCGVGRASPTWTRSSPTRAGRPSACRCRGRRAPPGASAPRAGGDSSDAYGSWKTTCMRCRNGTSRPRDHVRSTPSNSTSPGRRRGAGGGSGRTCSCRTRSPPGPGSDRGRASATRRRPRGRARASGAARRPEGMRQREMLQVAHLEKGRTGRASPTAVPAFTAEPAGRPGGIGSSGRPPRGRAARRPRGTRPPPRRSAGRTGTRGRGSTGRAACRDRDEPAAALDARDRLDQADRVGWRGRANSSAVVASSTICPAYMTATRSTAGRPRRGRG